MLYKSNKSFCGLVNMRRGEVKELTDEAIIKDLLRVGYIEPVKAEGVAVKATPEAKADTNGAGEAKPAKRGRKPKSSEG